MWKHSLLALTALFVTITAVPVEAVNIVVNSNDDTDDGTCDSTHCSLREAINLTNQLPGPDLITFSTGSTTISPTSVLPTLTDDGTTIRGEGLIVLNGVNLPGFSDDGLVISSSYNKIQGLIIRNFGGNGINLQTSQAHPHADYNVIGVDGSGRNDTTEGNVIRNNARSGIQLDTVFESNLTVDHNVIAGNIIGLNAAGTVAQPNKHGVLVYQRAKHNRIGTNFDGLSDSLERNIISANEGYGVCLIAEGDFNTIAGNFIGTDASGTVPLGNKWDGVGIWDSSHNVVQDNVISANENNGVLICGATYNIVIGNKIGTDVTGTQDLGNDINGIEIISGKGDLTFGNEIGFAGNYNLEFVTSPNVIAFNGWNGIFIPSRNNTAFDNAFLYNSIFNNALMGIDLVSELCPDDACTDGVTFNDPNDTDSGANGALNFPNINSVQSDTTNTYVTASINGGLPNTSFIIQFFANATPDATGYGEGKLFLGETWISTDGSGNGSTGLLTFNTSIPVGEYVCSTATLHTNWGPVATSEFSASIEVKQKIDFTIFDIWKDVDGIIDSMLERGDASLFLADSMLFHLEEIEFSLRTGQLESALLQTQLWELKLQTLTWDTAPLPQDVRATLLDFTSQLALAIKQSQEGTVPEDSR